MNLTLDSITEIEQLAMMARDGDLEAYSKAIHDWETEPYQNAWELALEQEDRLLIICPPDTYKSSTVQCWIEQKIGLNPNIRILWLMNAGAQSEARMLAVSETIENNSVYRAAFNVRPDREAKWTKTAIYVQREMKGPDPTLMGCGFNGPYQGLHFDIIIIDDPTDQEDVHSPVTMERQRAKLRGVILDRLARSRDGTDTSRIVAIMTRWGEDDLVPTFEQIGFRVVTMPVIGDYPWGPTISNTRFPMSRCQILRQEKTDAIFDLTYMCNPSALDGGIIRREYLRYWDSTNLPSTGCITLMAIDPAASLKTWADPSCIGTGVLEVKTRKLFISDVWRGKVPIDRLEAEIKIRAGGLANLAQIGLETKGFQLTMMQRLRRESRLPLRELPYRTRRQSTLKAAGLDNDKHSRAIAVAQAFTDGNTYLAKDLPMFEGVSVEQELCAFPYGAHDECVDIVAFLRAMADTYSPQRMRVKLGRN